MHDPVSMQCMAARMHAWMMHACFMHQRPLLLHLLQGRQVPAHFAPDMTKPLTCDPCSSNHKQKGMCQLMGDTAADCGTALSGLTQANELMQMHACMAI
jgi:hypothetical protein